MTWQGVARGAAGAAAGPGGPGGAGPAGPGGPGAATSAAVSWVHIGSSGFFCVIAWPVFISAWPNLLSQVCLY